MVLFIVCRYVFIVGLVLCVYGQVMSLNQCLLNFPVLVIVPAAQVGGLSLTLCRSKCGPRQGASAEQIRPKSAPAGVLRPSAVEGHLVPEPWSGRARSVHRLERPVVPRWLSASAGLVLQVACGMIYFEEYNDFSPLQVGGSKAP